MDHSFEMLLKSSILERGGKIRERGQKETIGFEKAIRKSLSEINVINEEQALVLQAINGLRDAAQHHLLELSESQLYFHAQSGVTLFKDILWTVFSEELTAILPGRVLPLSTLAITEPMDMFTSEAAEIRELLKPGKRKRTEAAAKLRGLAIVDGALQGTFVQPSESQLSKLGQRLLADENFESIFPGIGAVNFTAEGSGRNLSIRISKREGIPVSLVAEGTVGAGVVATKRVDELGFYNLSHRELARRVNLTPPKTTAAVWLLNMKNDSESCKEFVIGKSHHVRYSQNAITGIKQLINDIGVDEIWAKYRSKSK